MKPPIYIWALMIYVIFIGIKSRKEHQVFVPKMFILPIVLNYLKFRYILDLNFLKIIIWILILLCFGILGYSELKNSEIRKVKKFSIILRGNKKLLVMSITFFIIKFFMGFKISTCQQHVDDLQFLDLILSGMFSAYFLGKAFFALRKSL